MTPETVFFVAPTLYQRIIGTLLGLALLFITVRLVRQFRLREEHGLPWMIGGLSIILFCLWPRLLEIATSLLGFGNPSTTIFVATLFFLAVNALMVSCTMSRMKRQIQSLAIEVALLRELSPTLVKQDEQVGSEPITGPSLSPDLQ